VVASTSIRELIYRDCRTKTFVEGIGLIQNHESLDKLVVQMDKKPLSLSLEILNSLNCKNNIKELELQDFSTESLGKSCILTFPIEEASNKLPHALMDNSGLQRLNLRLLTEVKSPIRCTPRYGYLVDRMHRTVPHTPHTRLLYEDTAAFVEYVLLRNRMGIVESHTKQQSLTIITKFGDNVQVVYDYLRRSSHLRERLGQYCQEEEVAS